MADQSTERVLFEIRLDGEQFKQEQKLIRDALAAQVLELERTRQKQKELKEARKEGTVTDEAFAQQSVKLSEDMQKQQANQKKLQKGLLNSQKAYQAAADSIDQLKARSAALTIQYNAMAKEQRLNTEEGKALTAELLEVNEALKECGTKVGDNRRNVGGYLDAIRQGMQPLESLVKEMVKLQEQQKQFAQGSEDYNRIEQQKIGFMTAAQQAAARQGKSYQESTETIQDYAAAIQPATAQLVQLEAQQARLVESGGEATEQYRKIGFQIAAVNKQLDAVPAETAGAVEAIEQVDEITSVFGGNVGGLKECFAQAKQGIELAKGGFTGLKGAIASTGIGVLILALAALYDYFVNTDDGAEDLAAGIAFLKGGFGVLGSVVTATGKGLVMVFKEPKKTAKEFVDFLANNVVNRVKSFGVIWDGIRNGDAKGLVNGIVQFGTGVEDGIGKIQRLGAEIARAAAAAAKLSRDRDELDNQTRKSLADLERNKNLIDQLVVSAKDRSLTEKERLANLDRASQLETDNLNTTIALAKEKLRIIQAENEEAKKKGKLSDEQLDAEAAANVELIKLAGQSATLQQSIANRRSALIEQQLADEKARRDKARAEEDKRVEAELQARREAGQLQLLDLNKQLKAVQANSDEELNILQRKLAIQRDIELARAKQTAGQKKLINERFEQESLALGLDFARRRVQGALQLVTDSKNADLALAREGSAEQLQLQRELIEQQRRQQLAALDVRQNNEAQVRLINAQAAKAAQELEFTDSLRRLEQYLAEQRTRANAQLAAGELTQAEHQAALQAIERAGQQARIVTLEDYGRDATAEREAQSQQEVEQQQQTLAAKQALAEQESTIRLSVAATAADAADLVIQALGEETAAGQVALGLKKTSALAEIALNLQKELSAISANAAANPANAVTFGAAGASQATLLTAIAITKAAVSTAKVLAFADGGLVQGPGGPKDDRVPAMLSNGEGVMTARAVALFGPLLSLMNVMGGGRAWAGLHVPPASLVRLAEGGGPISPVRYEPSWMDALRQRGNGPGIDYNRLADAIAARQERIDYAAMAAAFATGAAALPPGVVEVVEINRAQKALAVAETRADQ